MTVKRGKEIVDLLKYILKEIKDDDDCYLKYRVSGLERSIDDFQHLIKNAEGETNL